MIHRIMALYFAVLVAFGVLCTLTGHARLVPSLVLAGVFTGCCWAGYAYGGRPYRA